MKYIKTELKNTKNVKLKAFFQIIFILDIFFKKMKLRKNDIKTNVDRKICIDKPNSRDEKNEFIELAKANIFRYLKSIFDIILSIYKIGKTEIVQAIIHTKNLFLFKELSSI